MGRARMAKFEEMRATVASGLREYIGCPVVRSNQNEEMPSYPYCSYSITTLMSENKGTYGEYSDGIDRKPFTQIWSFSILSNDYSECVSLANKAHEWLDHIGTVYLNDNGVIVQSVGSVNNRDNLLTVEYEYRQGFDVVFWLMNEVESRTQQTGYIEYVSIGDTVVEPSATTEELIELLEKRLDGDI
jgi:hypothetical protein